MHSPFRKRKAKTFSSTLEYVSQKKQLDQIKCDVVRSDKKKTNIKPTEKGAEKLQPNYRDCLHKHNYVVIGSLGKSFINRIKCALSRLIVTVH